ncbi:Integration host factor beta subunit [uncultured Gammaproteobacteria bacterium]|uniref:HU family DNA-binding protein n=1 Tax=Bathymodiolus heckerae thiotrophic gill symbiont TaxID=1052212 RepID=UPI0010B1E55D|nr:HU family DNA-binding protein [Bathymodiolus heckerae thiotrophic gill symbiont]CAC9456086.1 Integration host factor beta subunit [uncultured Gammaproteobacteria bacterium]CAC9459332.1 Integration host factor beta subunit [uncultured Gammaproteobacteria bacterium]SMN13470.1 Integration host factor beta subunit [Bathymodiolus heckerae thiotrophic gill symbiont]SMN14966.1 Integration host factor beta subunit [uncultured Candidatus Thioglobus sp.]
MKKTDLILNLFENSTLPKSEVKACVDIILTTLTESIVTGKGVEIRGFGSFHRRHKKARLGINPRSKERTQVGERFTPFFKPGKLLREVVNKK